jgi:hypothetical protein
MRTHLIAPVIAILFTAAFPQEQVLVIDQDLNVTYVGFERNGIEIFLNIKYGEDTSGINRFKPPQPFTSVGTAPHSPSHTARIDSISRRRPGRFTMQPLEGLRAHRRSDRGWSHSLSAILQVLVRIVSISI